MTIEIADLPTTTFSTTRPAEKWTPIIGQTDKWSPPLWFPCLKTRMIVSGEP